jgi:hypothetical protein
VLLRCDKRQNFHLCSSCLTFRLPVSDVSDIVLSMELQYFLHSYISDSRVSPEWLGHYNRPLSICPWKKSLWVMVTKSWWYFTDCWQSTRDFWPAAQALPIIKYYCYFMYEVYHYILFIIELIFLMRTIPTKEGKGTWKPKQTSYMVSKTKDLLYRHLWRNYSAETEHLFLCINVQK